MKELIGELRRLVGKCTESIAAGTTAGNG